MPSGYFSEPQETLDPDLFKGDVLKEDVRTGLLNLLYSDLEDAGFNEPWHWAHAWLAGSGISYQWSADRGNGDLDVLFGADFPVFLEDNPQFPRLSMAEVAEYTNQLLRVKAWPKTKHTQIGGSKKHYEITFFWNSTTGTSIDSIHPYAAYDLNWNAWSVRPPVLPADPRELYPEHWFEFTNNDYWNAVNLENLYRLDGPTNRLQALNASRALWRDIHEGRKEAFSDTGGGYGDFHNFRWQRAKALGTAEVLRGILGHDEPEVLPSPRDIITRAALRYANPRYTG